MPIAVYCPPENINVYSKNLYENQYKLMSECGVNIVLAHGFLVKGKFKKEVTKALKLCEKYNLFYLIKNEIAKEYISLGEGKYKDFRKLTEKEKIKLDKRFEKSLKQYSKYKAFGGICFIDEPGFESFEGIARAKKVFETLFPEKIFYVNMFPYYITPSQFQFGNDNHDCTIKEFYSDKINAIRYDYFLKKYNEIVKPKIFSYDAYPFVTLGNADTGYHEVIFEMQQIAQNNQKNYGIPYWMFLQAGGLWENNLYVRVPKKAEVQFSVNAALTFGASGLEIFPYSYPNDWLNDDIAKAGLIDKNGEKTVLYDYFKQAFIQVKAIGNILLKSKHKGIIVAGKFDNNLPLKEELEKIKWNETIYNGVLPEYNKVQINDFKELKKVNATVQCVIGCYEKNKKSIFYVTNTSTVKSSDINMIFEKELNLKIIEKGYEKKLKTNEVKMTLAEGGGFLIEVLD